MVASWRKHGIYPTGPPMPTVLRVGRFRFFFFSNEGQEPAHIHVKAGEDEAKFWLTPVHLAANHGFNGRELNADFRGAKIGDNLPRSRGIMDT
jgi:hypothetical protein